MIVLDASVLVELLLRGSAAPVIETRLLAFQDTLHAPHLIDVETAHVVRRRALLGEIGDDHARTLLVALNEFPLRRYPHSQLLQRMWELRNNFSAYDATYVALAETLDAPLFTRDRRLAAAATQYIAVELG